MENHKIYHFLTGILRACLKSQFNILLIFILKGFLGVISLTFIPFAEGGSQRIRKILADNIGKPSHTADLADIAVTPSVLPAETSTDSVLNAPDISQLNEQTSAVIPGWGQEPTRGFPTETLNKVQDTVEDLIATAKKEEMKFEMKSLWQEMEEKILAGSLTIPEVIDLLREKIFIYERNPYKINAIITVTGELLIKYPLHDTLKISQTIDSLRDIIFKNMHLRITAIELIEKLLIKYPLSQSEVLKTLNLLQIELSLEQTNPSTRKTITKCIESILEKYNLPESEILKALNQIKEKIFQKNLKLKEEALRVTILFLKTNKVSDTDKETIISWITDHLNDDWWRNRISATETLKEFLSQNIISNPQDRRDITLKIAERISTDENWGFQTEAVKNLTTLLKQQDTVLNPDDKREIVYMLSEMLFHHRIKLQMAVIQLFEILLSQIELPPTKRSEIAHKIVLLIFDYNGKIRSIAARMTENLWTSDLPLPEKLKIVQFLSKQIYEHTSGIPKALNVLLAAKQADLPLDFDMIHYITDMIPAPFALGKAAENLVREYLNTPSLSDDPDTDARLKLTLHLALEEQLSKRSQLAQEQSNKAKTTDCQKSMLTSGNTQPDAS